MRKVNSNKYYYSLKNIDALRLKLFIGLSKNAYVINLQGESGSVKTTFLNCCFRNRSNDVLWISCEMLKNNIIDDPISPQRSILASGEFLYVIFENTEDLKGYAERDVFLKMVGHLYNSGKKVIITETRKDKSAWESHYPVKTFIFRKVRPTRRMIRQIANTCGVPLSNEEIGRILEESDSLIGLEGIIRRHYDK